MKQPRKADRISAAAPSPWEMPLRENAVYTEQELFSSISAQINNSRLPKYGKEQADAFLSEISPKQAEIVNDWVNKKGAHELFTASNIRSTAEKLIKETVTEPTPLKITQKLTNPSFFRPQVSDSFFDSEKKEPLGISFSNYYYDNGEYRISIYQNCKERAQISIGNELPHNSSIGAWSKGIREDIIDQSRLYVEMMLSPSMLAEMASSHFLVTMEKTTFSS